MGLSRVRRCHRLLSRLCAVGAAALLLCSIPGASGAQDNYPAKPVRVLIGFAAGGGTDFLARVVADKMFPGAERVIVENRPGGGGQIAVDFVKRAAPDGYTLLMGPAGVMTVAPAVDPKVQFATLRDFAPITMVGSYPFLLVANAALPVRSVEDLVAWAKANPSKANLGGSAISFRLVAELFKQQTGMPFEFITYKSSTETVNALMAGEVAMTFVDSGPVSGQIKSGQVRGLAVTTPKRAAAFPDLPTLEEAGVKGVEVVSWAGLFAPAATPPAVVRKIQDEVVRVLRMPEIRQQLAARETEAVGNTSDEFARIIAAETARWAKIAKDNNIRIEQ
jgi:tripartite-type tricarboxylate transporter receptor subunit TctC